MPRFDIEWLVGSVVASYLQAELDPAIQAACPVVAFYDPMSIDEANRIVVLADAWDTMPEAGSNFAVQVDIAVKTRWTQDTIAADLAAHWGTNGRGGRVHAVRDVLFAANLAATLASVASQAGLEIGINYVRKQRHGKNTTTTDGWLYTETNLIIDCFAT